MEHIKTSIEKHKYIIYLFEIEKCKVVFDIDGRPDIIGARGEVLTPHSGEYLGVSIFDPDRRRSDGTKKSSRTEQVHVLVYLWCVRTPWDTKTHQIHHKNGKKHDNRFSNLELVGNREHGRLGQNPRERSNSVDDIVPEIYRELILEILIKSPFPNHNYIGKLFGLSKSAIKELDVQGVKP